MKFPRNTWQSAKPMHRIGRSDDLGSGLSAQGDRYELARRRAVAYDRKVRPLQSTWQERMDEAEAEMTDYS
jgi:hypothetical protein